MEKTCTAESCHSHIYARSLCRKHYISYNRGNQIVSVTGELLQKKLPLCSVEGCEKVTPNNGLCIAHKTRMERYDTLEVPIAKADVADKRFWNKVSKTDFCWNWTASIDSAGHGRFFYEGVSIQAHRYSYMREYGEVIQDAQKTRHTCNNASCVRPSHVQVWDGIETEDSIRAASSHSQSGVRGVSLHKPSGKWMGNVGHKGKVYYVGLFSDISEAESAVVAKRNELIKDVVLCTCAQVKGVHARVKGCTRRETRRREFGPSHPCLYSPCSKETTNPKFCSPRCAGDYRVGKSRIDFDDWVAGKVSISDSVGRLTQAVKNYLLREAKYSCTRCGWNTPNPKTGKPILCVDHVDGNWRNNFKNNLVVLCYNCHSLTPTFGGLNRGNTVSPRSVFSRKIWMDSLSDAVDVEMASKGEM